MHDISHEPERTGPGYGQEDWDDVSDTPELTDAEIAELRPVSAVPEIAALLPKRGRGRPRMADAKVNLTLRVEPGLLAAYRATGEGWQVRMHEALAAGLAAREAAKGRSGGSGEERRVAAGKLASKAAASLAGSILTRRGTELSARSAPARDPSKRPKSA